MGWIVLIIRTVLLVSAVGFHPSMFPLTVPLAVAGGTFWVAVPGIGGIVLGVLSRRRETPPWGKIAIAISVALCGLVLGGLILGVVAFLVLASYTPY
ncbi:hypothetical protein M2152_001364 [Microbacteriaceae bacterium SG_E_30_P1]|uniref:DUF4190 domain-containing protein n=1 Tax=Antiquaquibacter oligotrophicus TaxID=2880260 RepID=A0ABT6KQ00_9MICO|nr:hypothetical protein [Antiquaquibacter oligotrophicus]MDH6181182.1 hypothetical protein [Antiquaquibacter oligotrophicus]UDF13123.1 hypothetical protein LH407_13320 [Antiquaquibacter oligotrophicus]